MSPTTLLMSAPRSIACRIYPRWKCSAYGPDANTRWRRIGETTTSGHLLGSWLACGPLPRRPATHFHGALSLSITAPSPFWQKSGPCAAKRCASFAALEAQAGRARGRLSPFHGPIPGVATAAARTSTGHGLTANASAVETMRDGR